MNDVQLLLSAQRAMLFNISPKFRMISIDVDRAGVLKCWLLFQVKSMKKKKILCTHSQGK